MSHLGCACSQCFLLPSRGSVRFAISRNVWQIAKYSFPNCQLSNCSSRRRRLHRRSVSLYQRLRGRYPPVEQERENNMRGDRLKDFQKRKKSLIVAENETQFRRIKKSFIQKWLIRENQLQSVLRPSVGCLPPTPPQRRLFCFSFFIRKLPLKFWTGKLTKIIRQWKVLLRYSAAKIESYYEPIKSQSTHPTPRFFQLTRPSWPLRRGDETRLCG